MYGSITINQTQEECHDNNSGDKSNNHHVMDEEATSFFGITTTDSHGVDDEHQDLMSKTIRSKTNKQTSFRTPSQQRALTVLTVTVWISMASFGAFASLHYVRKALLRTNWHTSWDLADLHLYRPHQPVANGLMVTHMVFGTLLMLLGPIQLLPPMRRFYLNWHRWIGRLYIVAAVVTPTLAIAFTVVYRTSRMDPYEDVANVIFGTCMIVGAVQSYRYIRTGCVEHHKWWSYRLFSVVLGAVAYRLYSTVYFALILFTSYPGTRWIFESTFFGMVLPHLVVVQAYKTVFVVPHRNKENSEHINLRQTLQQSVTRMAHSAPLFWLCTLFVATTTVIIAVYSWIPSILDIDIGQADSIEHFAYPNETVITTTTTTTITNSDP